jgi:hypothetical protein
MARRFDFPSRRADCKGVPCHSGNLDLQDHIVGACELESSSAHASQSQKAQSFAQRPRDPFPFGQIALFANPVNEFSRILPAEDEFACSSRTKSMEILSLVMLAVTASTFLLVAWVAARGCSSSRRSCQLMKQLTLLPTEHFSHNEDEYCSAKAPAQEQIQQGIACCG